MQAVRGSMPAMGETTGSIDLTNRSMAQTFVKDPTDRTFTAKNATQQFQGLNSSVQTTQPSQGFIIKDGRTSKDIPTN